MSASVPTSLVLARRRLRRTLGRAPAPDAARQGIAEALALVHPAEVGVAFGLRCQDGRTLITDVAGMDEADLAPLRRYAARPELACGEVLLTASETREGGFDGGADRRCPLTRHGLGDALAACGFVSHRRRMVVRDGILHGLVLLGSRRPQPLPAEADRALEVLGSDLDELLVRATPWDDAMPDAPAEVLCNETGHPCAYTDSAAGLVEHPEVQRGLRAAIAEARDHARPPPRAIRGLAIRVARLNGSSQARWLLRLSPTRPLRQAPRHRLTGRQREVAELAAQGATNREIGAALGISAETVKVHLRRAYEALQVGSRAELGQALGPYLTPTEVRASA